MAKEANHKMNGINGTRGRMGEDRGVDGGLLEAHRETFPVEALSEALSVDLAEPVKFG